MVTLSILTGTGLVDFLVTLVIIAVVIYGISLLLDMLNLPANIYRLIWLLAVVVIIIYLYKRFGGNLGL